MSFPNYLGKSCQPKYIKTKEFVQAESEYIESAALGFEDTYFPLHFGYLFCSSFFPKRLVILKFVDCLSVVLWNF